MFRSIFETWRYSCEGVNVTYRKFLWDQFRLSKKSAISVSFVGVYYYDAWDILWALWQKITMFSVTNFINRETFSASGVPGVKTSLIIRQNLQCLLSHHSVYLTIYCEKIEILFSLLRNYEEGNQGTKAGHETNKAIIF